MIKIYDRVVLTVNLPKSNLKKGDVGTIVMIHEKGKGFEVEFFALDGSTISIETVLANQVRKVKKNEIAHVRNIAA